MSDIAMPAFVLMLDNGQIWGRFLVCLFPLVLGIIGIFCKKTSKTEFILGFFVGGIFLLTAFFIAKDAFYNIYTKRPLLAFYNTGLCFYHEDEVDHAFYNKDHAFEWNKISNLIEKTGSRKELILIYNKETEISIPKLTIEIADMKRKFEDYIEKSRLQAKSDQPFQCPALEVIVSKK